jgi:hypothetical protein
MNELISMRRGRWQGMRINMHNIPKVQIDAIGSPKFNDEVARKLADKLIGAPFFEQSNAATAMVANPAPVNNAEKMWQDMKDIMQQFRNGDGIRFQGVDWAELQRDPLKNWEDKFATRPRNHKEHLLDVMAFGPRIQRPGDLVGCNMNVEGVQTGRITADIVKPRKAEKRTATARMDLDANAGKHDAMVMHLYASLMETLGSIQCADDSPFMGAEGTVYEALFGVNGKVKYDHAEYAGCAIRKHMGDLGFSVLGNGHFSVAVKWDKYPGYVFKIGTKAEDSGAMYAAWARQNPGVHVPTIFAIQRFSARLYIVLMPEYFEVSYDDWHRSEGKFHAEERAVNAVLYQEDEYDSSDFAQTLIAIKRFFDGVAQIDMHRGNVMQTEDGELVITDPVSFQKGVERTDVC